MRELTVSSFSLWEDCLFELPSFSLAGTGSYILHLLTLQNSSAANKEVKLNILSFMK